MLAKGTGARALVFRASAVAWIACAPALGQNTVEFRLPYSGSAYDDFGEGLALQGDTIMVGAPGGPKGAVHVYRRSGKLWELQQEVRPVPAAEGFGGDIAIDGNTAIIGAGGRTGTAGVCQGAAYIFERNDQGWWEKTMLVSDQPAERDWFGGSVALSGDTALVGNHPDDAAQAAGRKGATHVFVREGHDWKLQTRLEGGAIALSGDTAIIGQRGKTGPAGMYQGVALVFVRAGGQWTQQAELRASDGAGGDCFGNAALDGDVAIISAYEKGGPGGGRQGAAYIFRRTGDSWKEEAKLLAADGAASTHFGVAVAIDGDTALVGTGWKENAAYVFRRSATGWAQAGKLTASDSTPEDGFGFPLVVEGDRAVVSNWSKDGPGERRMQGAAYVFEPLPAVTAAPVQSGPATPTGPAVNLSLGLKPGDTFRYRYETKSFEYAKDGKTVESTLDGNATIEGKVTAGAGAGSRVELRYSHIAFESAMGTDKFAFDSTTEPTDASQKAVKRVMDQVMAKTIIVDLNEHGKVVAMGGLPTLFEAIQEYQHEDEIRAAGQTMFPGLMFVHGLGTFGIVSWYYPLLSPGVDPPQSAPVGAEWQSGEEHLLQFAALEGTSAVIEAAGPEKGLPPEGHPLRAPLRYVWDTATGTLLEWEGSFDSATMQGGGNRSVYQSRLVREQLNPGNR